jgi:hypothetical protein
MAQLMLPPCLVRHLSLRHRARKRAQGVEGDQRTMLAGIPGRLVLNRIGPSAVAPQKPIVGNEFELSQARHSWLQF